MKLKLLTPEKSILERDVLSVTLPGSDGQLTIMDGHDFLVTTLKKGALYFQYLDKDNRLSRSDYTVESGLAEIIKNVVTVFMDQSPSIRA